VEVTFSGGPSGTIVELTHTGWEFFAGQAKLYRSRYRIGWNHVLGLYAGANRLRLAASTVTRVLLWWITHPVVWGEMLRAGRRRT
jgi:hypothetical protein